MAGYSSPHNPLSTTCRELHGGPTEQGSRLGLREDLHKHLWAGGRTGPLRLGVPSDVERLERRRSLDMERVPRVALLRGASERNPGDGPQLWEGGDLTREPQEVWA